jgi:hypothetical protein
VFADPDPTIPFDGERREDGRDAARADERAPEVPKLAPMSDGDRINPEPTRPDRHIEVPSAADVAAALRDAQEIAARVALDEAAADAERDRLAREPLPILPCSAPTAFVVRADERLHAERRAARVERWQDQSLSGGTLYLTSQRLVHVGVEASEEIDLSAISDMGVAMERLLLVELADGSDLVIEVDQPRLLRVQLAAARVAARERVG